jgi:uncharacterized protein with NAD-binding domain and iron-sulfur cluster
VTGPHGRVAILGGGMAGLSAAWRLSEPGWQDRFESITVYQRGWRLGGKAASSRGPNGRIEEHGLHVWLGSYENAFTLLRECYAELDRATTDPDAPVQTWDQALIPANTVGVADRWDDDWLIWLAKFTPNDGVPGEPGQTGRETTIVDWTLRVFEVIADFCDSLLMSSQETGGRRPAVGIEDIQRGLGAAAAALSGPATGAPTDVLTDVLAAVRRELDLDRRPNHKRAWLLISVLAATARGVFADHLATDPRGFAAINDEDLCDWLVRHGAHPDIVDFPILRGLYNLVFGYRDCDPDQRGFAAGVAVFLSASGLFQHRGALFWKMTAGMGDVVIAPIYQALRRRGVEFEFFHRVDELHLDAKHRAIESISMGRQAELVDGASHYEPLTRVRGLPVFPDRPLADQVRPRPGIDTLESHFGSRDDVDHLVLRRGVDFDHVVLALSVGMVKIVAGELIDDRPEWRDMTDHIATVATQAFQIWLRQDERKLGWDEPGVTTSAYVQPFDTWASMPQTLWTEDWPETDPPGAVAYFCGQLAAEWPTTRDHRDYVGDCEQRVHAAAAEHLDRHIGLYLPGAMTEHGFDWRILACTDGQTGTDAIATQHVSVNIDPSDRYVQSLPGTDRYRLRPDESGYDNLVLAGDWTDSGLNAGCIESAVLSGLQAANALLGRGRRYQIRGFILP